MDEWTIDQKLRRCALELASADTLGDANADDVVKRAEAYYVFLNAAATTNA